MNNSIFKMTNLDDDIKINIKDEVLDNASSGNQEDYEIEFICPEIKIEPLENCNLVSKSNFSELKVETVVGIKEEDQIRDYLRKPVIIEQQIILNEQEIRFEKTRLNISEFKPNGISNLEETQSIVNDNKSEQENINFFSLKIYQGSNRQDDEGATPPGDKGNVASIPSKVQKEAPPVVKRHLCDVCQKAFTYPIDVARHKRIHTGEKPYGCSVCGKRFSYQTDLSRHRLIHTGEKPYVCGVCHKGFVQRVGLVRHMRTHTGERPYQCDTCCKAFTHSSHLTDHKRIHTGEKPYECNVCNSTFRQQVNLIQHMRSHTGERPYACDVCHKTFSRSNHLSTHKRTHAGLRPYPCSQCNRAFTQLAHLNRHNVSYHSNK